MRKLVVAFRSFAKKPKNVSVFERCCNYLYKTQAGNAATQARDQKVPELDSQEEAPETYG